jgi:signal transduction histidine kinase
VSIVLISLACAVSVGVVGLVALRGARRAPMFVQLCVIVVTTVSSLIVGMVVAAQAMYISQHDLLVLFYIAGSSALVSLGIALILGRSFTRNSTRLLLAARAIGDGVAVETNQHRNDSTEFAALASELASTSARLTESRVKVEQLDASRREFFAWISHDLRTPLAGLRAMTEALEDQLAADPQRFHRQMLSQVDQLSSMVDDLFELSKIHSGTLTLNLEPVALYDLVSDAVAELGALALARSVTLREVSNDEYSVVGDPRELSRVIGNLLINAIQHSPPGAEIVVATRHGKEGHVVISVEDAGGGIPETDLPKIFEPGWRATSARTPALSWSHSSGAGLGLAIVQGIVEAHSGDVSVQNIPGGCRFDVSLPGHKLAAA